MMATSKHRAAAFSAVICAALLALAGCGGGGDAGNGATSPPIGAASPEGAYAGTVSGSPVGANAMKMLVLDDNTSWTVYGVAAPDGLLYAQGFMHGHGQVSGNQYTSSDARDYSALGVASASVSGSFTPGTAISGSVMYPSVTTSFNATTSAVAPYVYATPAQLSSVMGTWVFPSPDGSSGTGTVSADGTFVTESAGCRSVGTMAPRASGKNVFDVRITVGTSNCLNPGTAFSGIALVWPLSTGQTQLVMAALTADRNIAMYGASVR